MNNLLRSNKAINTQRISMLQAAQRCFASAPQKNPFDGVKTAYGKNHFYKLPLLADKRLGKSFHISLLKNHHLIRKTFVFREPTLLDQSAAGVCGS